MTFCLVVRALFVVFVVVDDEILLFWMLIFLSDELKQGFKISKTIRLQLNQLKWERCFFFSPTTCCSTSNKFSNIIILHSSAALIINMYVLCLGLNSRDHFYTILYHSVRRFLRNYSNTKRILFDFLQYRA